MRRMGRVAGEESAGEMVTETHDCSAKSWEGLSKRMHGARRGHSVTYIVHRYANHLKLVQNSTERKLQLKNKSELLKKIMIFLNTMLRSLDFILKKKARIGGDSLFSIVVCKQGTRKT